MDKVDSEPAVVAKRSKALCIILYDKGTIENKTQLRKGDTPLSTERYGKFIDFRLIIHRFQYETINSQ